MVISLSFSIYSFTGYIKYLFLIQWKVIFCVQGVVFRWWDAILFILWKKSEEQKIIAQSLFYIWSGKVFMTLYTGTQEEQIKFPNIFLEAKTRTDIFITVGVSNMKMIFFFKLESYFFSSCNWRKVFNDMVYQV